MKIKITILLFILCLSIFTKAQNLVINPSFEQHTQCPTQNSQISLCNHWQDAATNSTCDYYSAAGCTGNFSPPLLKPASFLTVYQEPLSGKSFAGFIPYLSSGPAEYLQGKFNVSLDSNKLYYIEFYLNATSSQKYFIHDVFALITDTAGLVNTNNLQQYHPQILPKLNKTYRDTTNWMRINSFYTAKGGEQYITMGDFTPNGKELKDSTSSQYSYAYYFVDSVGVYEVTHWDAWNAGPDKYINFGDSVQIGNPNNDLSIFDWVTSINSLTYLSDSTNPNPWSKPWQTTTYYVSKTQGATVFYDTVTVYVSGGKCNNTFWQAGTDKYIPLGDSVQLGDITPDNSTYNWVSSIGGNTYLDNSTSPSPWSKPTQNTRYYATKTCSGHDVFDTVTVYVIPKVNLGNDTEYCGNLNLPIILNAGAGQGYAYQWSTGVTTQTLAVTVSGTYSVKVSTSSVILPPLPSGYGTDGINLAVFNTSNYHPLHDTTLCDSSQFPIILNASVTPAAGYSNTYSWTGGVSGPKLTVNSAGMYIVGISIKDSKNNQCKTKDTAIVTLGCSGIEKLAGNNEQLIIYPNPTTGTIFLAYNLHTDAVMQLSDLSGNLVGAYDMPATETSIQVKNNYLQNGVYMYRIISNDILIKVGKIVVMQ